MQQRWEDGHTHLVRPEAAGEITHAGVQRAATFLWFGTRSVVGGLGREREKCALEMGLEATSGAGPRHALPGDSQGSVVLGE